LLACRRQRLFHESCCREEGGDVVCSHLIPDGIPCWLCGMKVTWALPSASTDTTLPTTSTFQSIWNKKNKSAPREGEMNIFQRWKQTSIANKSLVVSSFLMAFGTIFYAGAASVQVWIMHRTAKDSSAQTAKLIQTSQDQACAAKSFAASATNINAGIGTAVGKLNLQATQLEASVRQAARLAKATEEANANVINSDRPWMGAMFGVNGFASGATPTFTVVFTNSGRRPAKVTLTEVASVLRDYGNNPVYPPYDITPSISVAVPGQPLTTTWKEKDVAMTPIGDALLKLLAEGAPFRIYANVEYTDIRTDTKYWTHACWRYTPNQSPNAIGFSNCAEYNDAK
jgi:hypothetical protein